MGDFSRTERRILHIGGLTRSELKEALVLAGVQLNPSAETLLEDPVFQSTEAETVAAVDIVECSVGDLGLVEGATLPQILIAAEEAGLLLCPPFAGPYLRLAMPEQPSAPDTVMSNGRAPTGSVTVASERLRVEFEYPRGFYLRVVMGQPWLRGFRCTDDAPWYPEDRFAFRSTGEDSTLPL
jgi:hypothetical protein